MIVVKQYEQVTPWLFPVHYKMKSGSVHICLQQGAELYRYILKLQLNLRYYY